LSRLAASAVGFVLAIVVAACGHGHAQPDAADPHSAGACDSHWTQNGFSQCELACADSTVALGAGGPSCSALTASGTPIDCVKTFVFAGIRGCCAADKPSVLFADCR
jgi:hypothetical protein